jgi:tRNA U34 5-carboxymethylaminomethyl modifying enzyme MnmG/GidA
LDEARKLGENAAKFANENIERLASENVSIVKEIQEFNATWTHVVTAVGELHSLLNPDSLLERQGLVEDFATYFSTNMEKVLEALRPELEAPRSKNQSECYTQQEAVINKILDATEDVLVEACDFVNISHISEEQIREKFGQIKPHIRHAAVIIGMYNPAHLSDFMLMVEMTLVCLPEDHPYITRALILTAAIPILLNSKWISLRILRIILKLFGFGSAGPCKGLFLVEIYT